MCFNLLWFGCSTRILYHSYGLNYNYTFPFCFLESCNYALDLEFHVRKPAPTRSTYAKWRRCRGLPSSTCCVHEFLAQAGLRVLLSAVALLRCCRVRDSYCPLWSLARAVVALMIRDEICYVFPCFFGFFCYFFFLALLVYFGARSRVCCEIWIGNPLVKHWILM